jgi:hypothetical protein
MDFEHAKTPSYMDSMDNSAFSYMDNGLEYLQYPASPSFGVAMGRKSFIWCCATLGLPDYFHSSRPFSLAQHRVQHFEPVEWLG